MGKKAVARWTRQDSISFSGGWAIEPGIVRGEKMRLDLWSHSDSTLSSLRHEAWRRVLWRSKLGIAKSWRTSTWLDCSLPACNDNKSKVAEWLVSRRVSQSMTSLLLEIEGRILHHSLPERITLSNLQHQRLLKSTITSWWNSVRAKTLIQCPPSCLEIEHTVSFPAP